jgi:hypothetical protein
MKKALKTISPMVGILSTLDAQVKAINRTEMPHRKDVFTTKVKNIVIDTCCAHDTNMWETGVNPKEKWIIVEQYHSRTEAEKGHNTWVKKIKKNPKIKLTDIDIWNL